MIDFYNGSGVDLCCLGMAEVGGLICLDMCACMTSEGAVCICAAWAWLRWAGGWDG